MRISDCGFDGRRVVFRRRSDSRRLKDERRAAPNPQSEIRIPQSGVATRARAGASKVLLGGRFFRRRLVDEKGLATSHPSNFRKSVYEKIYFFDSGGCRAVPGGGA